MAKAKRLAELFNLSREVDLLLEIKDLNEKATHEKSLSTEKQILSYKIELENLHQFVKDLKGEKESQYNILSEELHKVSGEREKAIQIAQQLEQDNKTLVNLVKEKSEKVDELIESSHLIQKEHKQDIENIRLQYEQELFIMKRIGKQHILRVFI